MSKKADTHVLGSRDGYRCLAKSSGLSAAELSVLETLGFGQTSDPGFVQSLQHQPSAFCRILPTGRVAVSRCFAGMPDDAGRATLEIRSIVLSPDQYAAFCMEGLESFVADSGTWSAGAFDAGEQLEPRVHGGSSRRAIEPADLAIYDAWSVAATKSEAFIALPDRPDSHSAIFRFLQVIHPKDRLQFRWGVRLLSTGLGIHVGTIAPAGARGGRRRIIDMDPKQGPQSPAVRYLEESLRQGSLTELPPVATLHGSGGRAGAGTETDAVAASRGDRGSRFWVAGVALLLLAGGTVGTVAFLQSGQEAQQEQEAAVPATGNGEQQQIDSGLYSEIEAVLTSAEGTDGVRLVEILSNNRRILLGNRFEELRRQDGVAEPRVNGLERRLADRFDALREELESRGSDLRVQIRSELLPLLRNWQSAGSVYATPSASELLQAVERQPAEESDIDEDSPPAALEQPSSETEQAVPEQSPQFFDLTVNPESEVDPEDELDESGEDAPEEIEVQVQPVAEDPFDRIERGFVDPPSIVQLQEYTQAVREALREIENREIDEAGRLLSCRSIQALCVEWGVLLQLHRSEVGRLDIDSSYGRLNLQNISELMEQVEIRLAVADQLSDAYRLLQNPKIRDDRFFGEEGSCDNESSDQRAWVYDLRSVRESVLERLKAAGLPTRPPSLPDIIRPVNEDDEHDERVDFERRKRLMEIRDRIESWTPKSPEERP